MPTKLDPACSTRQNTTRSWWTPVAGLLAAGLVTALVACGGGGGSSAGVGTGGTGAFAVGTISGFGSIIVNGVRYDDSSATVVDDDDSSSSSSLAIGQVVEIRGSVNSDGVTGTASSISYYSALKGPVTDFNSGAGTFKVFGQVVSITATTLVEGVSSGSPLADGNVVEVYGLPDASGSITATRIEREALTIGAFSGDFRIRGVVSGLVATSPGQRFTIGTVTVQTDNATQIDGTIADGVFVKVRLDKTVAIDGSYLAKRVKVKNRQYESGVSKAEVQGLISEFTSPSAEFKVNGYRVKLDTSVTYEPQPGSSVNDLADGVRIEAKGVVTNGVLVISKVEFDDESNDGGADGSNAPFEFHGVVTCTACGSTTGSFEVRGVTVQYDATTRFENSLTPGTLNGARVEVKAIAQSGSGGTTLLATRIQLDN